MNRDFVIVARTGQYGSWEDAPGLDLKSGTEVIVRWPEGTESAETVLVKAGYDYSNLDGPGSPVIFYDTRYLVVRKLYKGVQIDVALTDLEVRLP